MPLQFRNSQLQNSSVSLGGVSISLGATDATPAFDLQDATAYPGDSSLITVGTIGTGAWQGSVIANAYIAQDLTIVSGSIDGSVIGGSTAAAGSFTTLSASGNITGSIATASQPSITGVGTLLGLSIAASQTVSMGSNKITNVADPTSAQDAATKAYVDASAQGLDVKESVRAASTANLTLSGTQTVDGVVLSVGNRILVKDQTSGTQNGIYIVAASGWARSSDFADGSDEAGAFCFVEEGTLHADNGFVCTNNSGSAVVGTDALNFTQFSGAGQIDAGAGMVKSGNTLNIGQGSGITVNADDIQISASYAGQTSIVTLGTIGTGTWQGSAIQDTYLANIAAANKVQGSAVQLATNTAIGNNSGLELKGGLAGVGLSMSASGGNQVLNVGGLTNAEVAGNAAIAFDKLAGLASANILVGNAGGDAAGVAMSGDASITNTGAVSVTSLQANAVNAAAITDNAVSLSKLGFSIGFDSFPISNSSTTSVNLTNNITDAEFLKGGIVQVFVNGQRLKYVSGTPSDNSQYKVTESGGTTTVTFGAAMVSGDEVNVSYFH